MIVIRNDFEGVFEVMKTVSMKEKLGFKDQLLNGCRLLKTLVACLLLKYCRVIKF